MGWFKRKKKSEEDIEELDSFEKGEGGSLRKFMGGTEIEDRYMGYIHGGTNEDQNVDLSRTQHFSKADEEMGASTNFTPKRKTRRNRL